MKTLKLWWLRLYWTWQMTAVRDARRAKELVSARLDAEAEAHASKARNALRRIAALG